METDQWTVEYQPIITISNGAPTITAWEALARGPRHDGPIPDLDVVYPLAIENRPDLAPLHLNLDIANIRPDTLDCLISLADTATGPIVWELIETGTVDEATTDLIADLTNNATISLDDIGTGPDDIRRIVCLPADEVKLDITVTHAAARNPLHARKVASLAEFLAANGISVVCEGVETQQQLDALDSIGLTTTQGWYWTKSMTPTAARQYNPHTRTPEHLNKREPEHPNRVISAWFDASTYTRRKP